VRADLHAFTASLGGAAPAQWAVMARRPERCPAGAADGAGDTGGAGHRAVGMVGIEIINGVPTRNRRARRCGFDQIDMTTSAQFGAELPGAVSGIGQHPHR